MFFDYGAFHIMWIFSLNQNARYAGNRCTIKGNVSNSKLSLRKQACSTAASLKRPPCIQDFNRVAIVVVMRGEIIPILPPSTL